MKKVLVVLATDPDEDGAFGQKHFIRQPYVVRLLENDLLPIFISNITPLSVIDRVYDECDGVLLPGGKDVNPALYKAKPHPKTHAGVAGRDELECELVRRTIRDRKPFLGICRGMQLLNVALGGTLHQHIGDLELQTDHGGGGNGLPYHLLPTCSHTIVVDTKSCFYQLFGEEQVEVSSGHHQAVQDIAPDLRVAATCEAGLIEVLEYHDQSTFAFGLQSHPEMMESEFADRLFGVFSKAVQSTG
jgi:putative glutamine amidotransferase